MIDLREPLKAGTILKNNNSEYVIQTLIGRGANCLVYDAVYYDGIGERHKVRIKELFPVYMSVERDDSGCISVTACDKKRFCTIKENFIRTYQRNTEIRNLTGLVNSTSNTQDIWENSGTCYSVCSYEEGQNYREYEDETLYELLRHVKALAKVISGYHEKKYLHLDIKPENVFIFPETAEHVMLFDFDSVVSEDEIKKKTDFILSYSAGFSAPEQKRGRNDQIGTWSDVYSIGALLYFKLFGKKADLLDIWIGKGIRIKHTKYDKDINSPKLERMLKQFFENTLAISRYARWKTMDDVLNALDQMIPMADPENKYIPGNFVYNENCFVGRRKELSAIRDMLVNVNAVFLSGIGGSGKTEIAKRYAYCYRESYNVIMFLRFDKSIREMISEQVVIKNWECDENDDIEKCYKSKLEIMKQVLTPEDLLIVDNFDVDYDKNLEELLECNCKFIFTTREDYRDYNYPQIDIGQLANREEAFALFDSFNDCDYSSNEVNAIDQLMKYVDYHTMMIVLISKYLRDSGENPSLLYEKFCKKEGVTNTGDTKVKHRKDKRLSNQVVNKHLKTLFEFSKFTERELQIMRALSLLGSVRIREQLWMSMVNNCFGVEEVNGLIKRGWIETDRAEKNPKISLHQIILDLIYNEEKPDTENCGAAVGGYVRYIQSKLEDKTDRRIRKKVADILLDRLKGNDLTIARFYYAYGKVKWNPEAIERAAELCEHIQSPEAQKLLVDIRILELSHYDVDEDLFCLESDEQVQECVNHLYTKVFRKELEIFADIRKCSKGKFSNQLKHIERGSALSKRMPIWNYLDLGNSEHKLFGETECSLLLQLAIVLCAVANKIRINNMIMEEGDVFGFSSFYLDAESILQYLYEYVIKDKSESCSYDFKEYLLTKSMEFYGEYDYTKLTQTACVGVAGKVAFYSECLEALKNMKKEKEDTCYTDDTFYMNAGDQADFDRRYSEAIAYYDKALQNEESTYDDIMYRKCDALIGLHSLDMAEKGLLDVLQYDITNNLDICCTCRKLIRVYKEKKDFGKVQEYGRLILSKIKEQEETNHEWVFDTSVELLNLELVDDKEKSEYRKDCMKCLRIMVQKDRMEPDIIDSLERFWMLNQNTENCGEELICSYYKIATRYRVNHNFEEAKRIYRCLINYLAREQLYNDIYIRSMLWVADLYINHVYEDYDLAASLLREVQKCDLKEYKDSMYFASKLQLLKEELSERGYWRLQELNYNPDSACNYFLIAENDIAESHPDRREQFEIWLDVADKYVSAGEEVMLMKSLKELKKVLSECFSSYNLKRYMERFFSAGVTGDANSCGNDIEELIAYIKKQVVKHPCTTEEQTDIIFEFSMGLAKQDIASGANLFLSMVYGIITNIESDFCGFVFSIWDRIEEVGLEAYMLEDFSSEMSNVIVTRTDRFLEAVDEDQCGIYRKIKEIKKHYEQYQIEFKSE